jgi:hypothetical protein
MKYLPVCFALSLAILFIIIAAAPLVFSKIACVVLGLVLLYCASRAKGSIGSESWEEESAIAGEESLHRAGAGPDATADRPRE